MDSTGTGAFHSRRGDARARLGPKQFGRRRRGSFGSRGGFALAALLFDGFLAKLSFGVKEPAVYNFE